MLCTPVSSSKHKDLCEKCDHLLDFGENCGLYRFCWLYLYVLTLFPLHFRRRMLYTPFSASRQAQLCAKCDHVLDFDDKLCVVSVLLEIFRCLNAISIAFYTPITAWRQTQLCAKCDHLHDFEENCALYPSCWRYFYI